MPPGHTNWRNSPQIHSIEAACLHLEFTPPEDEERIDNLNELKDTASAKVHAARLPAKLVYSKWPALQLAVR